MKINQVIEDVHDHEAVLANHLRTIAERHAAEPDIYHVGRAQARTCADRIEQLAPHAHRYGTNRRTPLADRSPGILEALRPKGAESLGQPEANGQLLLADLRELYLAAQATELAWTVLLQSTRAIRDHDLLETATGGQEQVATCAKWLRTRIKDTAPQVYAAG